MDILKEWVKDMFMLMIIATFIETLLPDNSTSKFVKYVFSLIIMAAMIYPMVKLIRAY